MTAMPHQGTGSFSISADKSYEGLYEMNENAVNVQEAGTGIPAAFNMKMWIAKGRQYVEETRILKEKKKK